MTERMLKAEREVLLEDVWSDKLMLLQELVGTWGRGAAATQERWHKRNKQQCGDSEVALEE